MERAEPLSIPDQHAAFLGAQQNAAGGERQQAGKRAHRCLIGTDLDEMAAIESEQTFARGRDPELQVGKSAADAGRDGGERRRWQLEANAIAVAKVARRVEFIQAAGAQNVKAAQEGRGIAEARGRADSLKSSGQRTV